MRPRPFLLLLAGVALVLMAAGEADAEKEPEWSYGTGDSEIGVDSVAISADGKYIAAGSQQEDTNVYLFGKDISTPLWSYTTGNTVRSVAISADGEYIAAGAGAIYLFDNIASADKTINVDNAVTNLDSDSLMNDFIFGAHVKHADVEGVNITVWKKNLLGQWEFFDYGTTDEFGTLYFKNVTSGEYLFAASVNGEELANEGGYNVVDSTYTTGHIGVPIDWDYDVNVNDFLVALPVGSSYKTGAYVEIYNENGDLVDSGTTSEAFVSYDLEKGNYTYYTYEEEGGDLLLNGSFHSYGGIEPLWSYTTGTGVQSVTISANGEYIAAGTNSDVYLFNKNSGTPLWSYDIGNYVWSVSISADGEYIAAGSSDDNVYLFHKDSSEPLWSYTTGNSVYSVAISADGEYITAGSYANDNKVYLFGKDSSTPIWSYTTGSAVYSVSISADGEYITAGSFDTKVYLFNRDSSTPLWSYDTSANVISVAISADGEHIAAGTGDDGHKVYLFDKDSSTPLWSYTAGYVNSVSISADGEYIAVGSEPYGGISSYGDVLHLLSTSRPPTATIDSISPSPARFDAEVFFSGSGSDSDGTVVAYEWISSRDGFLSDEEDFSITGFGAGNYTISFRVQDNDGEWSDWDTAQLEFYPNVPPDGTIDSLSPSPAKFDEEVTFSGSSSDSDGTVVAYLWESSLDGNLSTEEDFSSSDLSLGYHNITFRVQDNDGEWNSEGSASLFVGIAPIPKAGIDVEVELNTEVQFTGSGTDEDGTIVNYEWDLNGDGVYDWSSTLNGITTHIYNGEGIYYAVLRVTDNDNLTSTDTRTIAVGKALPPPGDGTSTSEGSEDGLGFVSNLYIVGALAVLAAVGGAYIYMQRDATGQQPAKQFTPTQQLTAIECPGCNAQMKVPKLGKMQTVTCDSCGLSGEIEV